MVSLSQWMILIFLLEGAQCVNLSYTKVYTQTLNVEYACGKFTIMEDNKTIIFLRPLDTSTYFALYTADSISSYTSPSISQLSTKYTVSSYPSACGVYLGQNKYLGFFSAKATNDRMNLVEFDISTKSTNVVQNIFNPKSGENAVLLDILITFDGSLLVAGVKYIMNADASLDTFNIFVMNTASPYSVIQTFEFDSLIENNPSYPLFYSISVPHIFHISEKNLIFFITLASNGQSFVFWFIDLSIFSYTTIATAYAFPMAQKVIVWAYSYSTSQEMIIINYQDALFAEMGLFLKCNSMNNLSVVSHIKLAQYTLKISLTFCILIEGFLISHRTTDLYSHHVDFTAQSVLKSISYTTALSLTTYDAHMIFPNRDSSVLYAMSYYEGTTTSTVALIDKCLFFLNNEQGVDVCRTKCDGLYQFPNGAACLQCSEALPYNENQTCVAGCSTSLPYLDTLKNTCVLACPSYLLYIDFHMRCLEKCPPDEPYILNSSSCVSDCPSNLPYKENFICVGSCSVGKLIYKYTCYDICPSLPKLTFEEGGECVERCPDGKFGYNAKCNADCSSAPASCIQDSVRNICFDCSIIQKFKYGATCVASCPEGMGDDSHNVCIKCKSKDKYAYRGKCIEKCPELTYVNSVFNTCTNCSDINQYYYSGICAQARPPGTEVTNTEYKAVTECHMLTPPKVMYQNICIDSCPPGQVLYEGVCIFCRDLKKYQYQDTCISDCDNSLRVDQENLICIDCKLTAKKYLYNNQCVEACPKYSTVSKLFVCTRCADDYTYFYTASDVCLSYCPEDTFTDVANFNCMNKNSPEYAEYQIALLANSTSGSTGINLPTIESLIEKIDLKSPQFSDQVTELLDVIALTQKSLIKHTIPFTVQSLLTTSQEIGQAVNELTNSSTSYVNIENCMAILKSHYHIKSDDVIRFVKIDFNHTMFNITSLQSYIDKYINGSNIIRYKLYFQNGTQMDMNLCENTIVEVYYPLGDYINLAQVKEFQDKGVDIYKKTEAFYNDPCFIYNNGISDITFNDRRKDVFPNMTLVCSTGCRYKEISIANKSIICECLGNVNNYISVNVKHDALLPRNGTMMVIFCGQQVFDASNIASNVGFFLVLAFHSVQFIATLGVLIFYKALTAKNLPKLIEVDSKTIAYSFGIIDFHLLNGSNISSNRNRNRNLPNPIVPPNPPRSSAPISETSKDEPDLHLPGHSRKGSARVFITLNTKYPPSPEKEHIDEGSACLSSEIISMEFVNYKFTVRDFNSMKFKDVITYDKRSIWTYYWHLLTDKHLFLCLIFKVSVVDPLFIRITVLFFTCIADLGFHGLLISDDEISKRYQQKIIETDIVYMMTNETMRVLWCALISSFLRWLISFTLVHPESYLLPLYKVFPTKEEQAIQVE